MLTDKMDLFSRLTGEDGWNVPIIKVGAILSGYETEADDCIYGQIKENENES